MRIDTGQLAAVVAVLLARIPAAAQTPTRVAEAAARQRQEMDGAGRRRWPTPISRAPGSISTGTAVEDAGAVSAAGNNAGA